MSIHPHDPAASASAGSPPPAANSALVPVRHRVDGWTPEKQRAFIEHLADTGSVREAAELVDMTEQSASRLRRRADAGAFVAAWDAALEHSLGRLTALALDRAVTGVRRKRWWKGECVGEEYVPSDKMLIWLIQKGRQALGRSAAREAVARDWEGALDALERPRLPGEPVGGYRVWLCEHGYPVTNFPPGEDWDAELFSEGTPGDPDYSRALTDAEWEAWSARQDAAAAPDPVEAERRRAFGLDG